MLMRNHFIYLNIIILLFLTIPFKKKATLAVFKSITISIVAKVKNKQINVKRNGFLTTIRIF